MYVLVVMIASAVLFLYLCTSVLRKKAAFVQWISRLVGRKRDENPSLTDSSSSESKPRSSKQKNTKKKLPPRNKSDKVGVSAILEDSAENKGVRKRVKTKKNSEDRVGFSFFRTNSHVLTETTPLINKGNKKAEPLDTAEDVDEVGFSFIPKRTKKIKTIKHEDTETEKKTTFSKPIRSKYPLAPVRQISVSLPVKNTEEKESKKVISTVSYAQVASNQIDLNDDLFINQNLKNTSEIEPNDTKLLNNKELSEPLKDKSDVIKDTNFFPNKDNEQNTLHNTTFAHTEDTKEKTSEFLSIEREINSIIENFSTELNNGGIEYLQPSEEDASDAIEFHDNEANDSRDEDISEIDLASKLEEIFNSKNVEVFEDPQVGEELIEPTTKENGIDLRYSIGEKFIKPITSESEDTSSNEIKSENQIGENVNGIEVSEEPQVKEYTNEIEFKLKEICNTLTNIEENITDSVDIQYSGLNDNTVESILPESVKIEEMSPPNSSDQQIRVLELNDEEFKEGVLYRLEKRWIVQFRLGPSLFGRKVYLYCNYPIKGEFDRNLYHLLSWSQDEGCENSDDTAIHTNIVCDQAGSFRYFFTFTEGSEAEKRGTGFFLIDPVIKYGNNEDLPLDCVQCQTIIAKNLGSFSSWERKLEVSKQCGYNMIHFTPVQELGASNSAYSISEQLKLNKTFKKNDGTMPTFEEVEKVVSKMRSEWKVASICDIVLNHTANESAWIIEHPEVAYNCSNCTYMRPAYLLDSALHRFSMDVNEGLYETKGIPPIVETEDHLNAIRYHLHQFLLSLKFEELFICDVSKYVSRFLDIARQNSVGESQPELIRFLTLNQDPEYRRLGSTIDVDLAIKIFNGYRLDSFDEDSRLRKSAEDFKNHLDSLNRIVTDEIHRHLNVAVDNTVAGIRYYRVQHDGPKFKEITKSNPLTYRYFTDYGNPKSMKDHEDLMYGTDSKFLMAHNGWVMNSDPLTNFAGPDSEVYIRRELIAWGDSVKLRFGDKPEDCPFLWDHMTKYVERTAKIFDGVRLDNCHSTPIPVAEYLLDRARKIRPNLYVVAELFTNSDHTDNIFVNRLGISSLIREAMSAWDSHEEGRLVYRYGGQPVGSFYQPHVRPLVPTVAHALFMDMTHDNVSPVEKRSIFDMLPSTALVNMACCASGSNRGYDELVPHHIHVVDEKRLYTEWTSEGVKKSDGKYISNSSGIIAAKKALNDLHFFLGRNGFNQVYVDQMDPDIVAVTRHCPKTHQSYILVSFTAFQHPNDDAHKYQRSIKPLKVEGVLDEIVLEASLSYSGESKYKRVEDFAKDTEHINGCSDYKLDIKQHIQVSQSDIFEQVTTEGNLTQLNFKNFKPGSIVIIKVSLPEVVSRAIRDVRNLISQFSTKDTELWKIVRKLDFIDLNRCLYRCDQEERDDGKGFDAYTIPNFAQMVYAGLQGFMSLLAKIRPSNDLGHPMCNNLRDGNWMIDFIWQRLLLNEGTSELGKWIERNSINLKKLPRYLIPAYFDMVVTGVYVLLMEHAFGSFSGFIENGSVFVKALAMGSVQFAGFVKSADLPILSPNLNPPKPPITLNTDGKVTQACVSLSAGLPHFSVGYMRNWGRDTFIALRGLFLLTGRYQDARYHILAYGACLRHGLIPNLLDGGRNPRFNCRDAVWWWLYCIKCYVEDAPNGLGILKDKVSRIFPKDDSPAQTPGLVDQTLEEVIQEALNVHFQGLAFRERNAGRQIDEHMLDNGFNNQIGVHPMTGFVFGGNSDNCGTWMDKMGSSDKAGNRGKPATPRDGSACEIIGLSKCVISWLGALHRNKRYGYEGVKRKNKNGDTIKWSFEEWATRIQDNFEKYFWINDKPLPDEIGPELINKRGIYKDCYGASQAWSDYQLRCNFPIVMVVAPELFDSKHAWIALEQAERYLVGPLGMKTLDPDDWAYRGDYDNSNDSSDSMTAHGFNYHQGPEWVWPIGFYLRAKLLFAKKNNKLNETIAGIKDSLSKHFTELQSSDWRGLPELTNSNGSYCKDSSRTQAWSMSCILEVLHDLQKVESDM